MNHEKKCVAQWPNKSHVIHSQYICPQTEPSAQAWTADVTCPPDSCPPGASSKTEREQGGLPGCLEGSGALAHCLDGVDWGK